MFFYTHKRLHINHAIKDYGLSYPKDLSFIGFDMEDSDRLFSPTITSVLQPGKQLGTIIVHKLLQAIEDNSLEPAQPGSDNSFSVIDPIIKLGESTRPLAYENSAEPIRP